MKKYIIFSVCVAVAFFATSCSDFLDVEAEGNITSDNVLDSDQNAIDLIDGLYYMLSSLGDDNLFARELMYEQAGANDMVWGRTRSWPELAMWNDVTYSNVGDVGPLVDVFEDFYTLIQRSNDVIYQLLKAESLTDVQKRSLGEAYFMRAFGHFYMAYRYGVGTQGVPFMRYEDYGDEFDYSIVPPQRATVMENYELVCEDLDKAIEYLPKFEEYGEADQGRAHKAAALGYKAKCLAYWACWDTSKWSEVISCVNELETSYGRGLADNFEDNFSSDFDKFWTKEYIFSIPSDGATNRGCELPGVMLEDKGWNMYNGWGYFKPTEQLYAEFLKDGDRDNNVRLKKTILAYNDEFVIFGATRNFWSSSDLEAGFAPNKYNEPFEHGTDLGDGVGDPDYDIVNPNGDWPTVRMNFPLLRFADLLLLRAEAYLNTNQAASATTDINRIRNRAGLSSLAGTATTADLYHERRVELAFEFSDHLYDCKRWAVSGDATLKQLAKDELNNLPTVRVYENREDPLSTFVSGCTYEQYEGYTQRYDGAGFQDYMIAFPYPSDVLLESDNAYKQNPGY